MAVKQILLLSMSVSLWLASEHAFARSPSTEDEVIAWFQVLAKEAATIREGFEIKGAWKTQRHWMPHAASKSFTDLGETVKGEGAFTLKALDGYWRLELDPASLTNQFSIYYGDRLASGATFFHTPAARIVVGREGMTASVESRDAKLKEQIQLPLLSPNWEDLFRYWVQYPMPEIYRPLAPSGFKIEGPIIEKKVNGEIQITTYAVLATGKRHSGRVWTLSPQYDYRPSSVQVIGEDGSRRVELNLEWQKLGASDYWFPMQIRELAYRVIGSAGPVVSYTRSLSFDPTTVRTGRLQVQLEHVAPSVEAMQHAGVSNDGTLPAARTDPHNQTFVEKVQENIWRIVFVLSLATGIALLLIRHRMNKPA